MDTKRFNNPEYKRQISAVRNYRRQAAAVPDTKAKRILHKTGIARTRNQILLVIAIALFVYLTYFAKFLMITDLSVAGADEQATKQIKQNYQDFSHSRRGGLFPIKNILYFNKGKFVSYLLKNNYQVASVDSISARLWNKLAIKVTQRTEEFTLQTGDAFYILNSDGAVGAQLPLDQPMTRPVVKDTAAENIAPGELFFDQTKNNFIHVMTSDIKNKLQLEIAGYEVPGRASNQLIIYVKGKRFIFTSTTDPEAYFQRLYTLWLSMTPEQQARVSYIDLRFEDNAYSCNINDPCDK